VAKPAVQVHVLPTSFHQSYARALNSINSAQANAPKGYSYAKGVHPTGKAAKIGGRTCAESNCPLNYFGGVVQHSPKVYIVLWGPNWTTDATQAAAFSYTYYFLKGLGDTTNDVWSPIMNQYYDGSSNVSFTGSVLVGAFQDKSIPPTGTTQSQFAAETNAAVTSIGITDN